MRSKLPQLALLLAAAPVGAAIVQAPSGMAAWFAVTTGGSACVRGAAETAEACWDLPAGHTLTDLREVAGGWVAAGYGAAGGIVDLFLVRGGGDDVETLPVPAGAGVSRGAPRLVADDNRLLGLVWLEGETQETLAVRAAEWLDGAWGATLTVSAPAAGSQVAPAVTVLGDGRWLLLWTAFDGEDDETVWSAFDGRSWSPPRPLHEDNVSPDITPAVLAVREGAVAAWSWLDGRDYRLRTAFFDGREWKPAPVLRGRGALQARLLELAGFPVLVYNTVVPAEWVAVEIGPRGELGRRSAAASERPDPPRVELRGDGVVFVWEEDAAEDPR